MHAIAYHKMSGAGNTFIILEGKNLPEDVNLASLAPLLCQNRLEHNAADGMIAIVAKEGFDFEMKYYNRDGSTGMMCGNGGRCAVQYAADLGYVVNPGTITFINAGITYTAALTERGVKVHFPEPNAFKLNLRLNYMSALRTCHYADVGTPHAVMFIDEAGDSILHHIQQLDLTVWGKELREHQDFAPEGANANFVEILPDENHILLRTYERGVEAETGACGTGAISSAIIAALHRGLRPPVKVTTSSGGTLWVDFRVIDGRVTDVSLEGNATVEKAGEFGETLFNAATL